MDRIKQAYIDNQRASGILASGASAGSLKTTAEPTIGQLLGFEYFNQQRFGRRPGKFPPIENIMDWVRQKLGISEEKELRTVTFLIGRKIAKSGTDIYQKKRPALSIEEKLLEARKELAQNLLSIEKKQIKEKFKRGAK